jgi:hypothetical protein
MYEVKLPFGQNPDGIIVPISVVPRGLECDCVCPECTTALVAVKGEIVRHHFRHHVDPLHCEHARETALHKYAKQLLSNVQTANHLILPPPPNLEMEVWEIGVSSTVVAAQEEVTVGTLRPDVLLDYEGETLAVEIWVAHEVPPEKIDAYAELEQAALQIDLRSYRLADRDDEWPLAILQEAPRHWLYPPRVIREERARRIEAFLAQKRQEAEVAEELRRQAEQARIEAERREQEERHGRAQSTIAEQIAAIEDLRREEWQRQREAKERHEGLLDAQAAIQDRERNLAKRRQIRINTTAPDLQHLVRAAGGYDRITSEMWAQFDSEMAVWQQRRRSILMGERAFGRQP